ncbi:hypothetical protein [Treponema sp.]|uniref:hypothetical protein n=1 Tax=Treponema sp. TaxID=166 RepID=UPI0038902B70
MELNDAVSRINSISSKSESTFLQLGNLFPMLMNRNGHTSLQSLRDMLSKLNYAQDDSAAKEKEVFIDYSAKYNPLFDKLNQKIDDLSKLDKMIAGIKEDSEQMSLIALNAMVVSIKSGEKGQAFSRITENLQRLSGDMSLFADKLSEEESHLIEYINGLKSIFSGIINSQKNLSSQGSENSSDVKRLISSVTSPLTTMENQIDSIYTPIQKAMEGLQLQDIINQSLQHVVSCISEITNSPVPASGSDEELDYICFNISLYELACDVLDDINEHVTKSYSIFNSNWQQVIEILDSIDNSRLDFESRFLNNFSASFDNIDKRLTTVIENFQNLLNEFNNYHLVQKDLLHTCQNITQRARTIYSVFDGLRPVMSRLHHVRILQQIEVSKNDAIKSVQDSVTDMDNLINSANTSLDEMQTLLENFIQDTSNMLESFTTSINIDNKNMLTLREDKERFFEELKAGKNNLNNIISNFTVFPEGFQNKCVVVQQNLMDFGKIANDITDFISALKDSQQTLLTKKASLINERGISNWEIRSDKFKDVIKHFTITAHKEAAGKIAGFDIEKGAASGEVTFF